MALGGGSFTSYNKVLPGTYINFVSAGNVSGEIAQRGICAAADKLSWGKEGEFVRVTAEEFMTNSMKLFGYSAISDNMKHFRDLFTNASVAYIYRLGEGVKAENDYAKAKYSGICGNDIKVKVSNNVDNAAYFDVTTYYSGVKRDVQRVKNVGELKDNDYVEWKKSAVLSETGIISLTGGSDGEVTGEDYQAFLEACEAVSYNVLALATTDDSVNSLVAAFTKRMREERGIKFQSVLYNCEADDIGVINVSTPAKSTKGEESLVWYVAGAAAGCEINKSLLNHTYKGNFEIIKKYTQSELEEGIKKGKFMLHCVDNEYRVLADINSLVNVTNETGEIFKENQTVRIVDQIAYDDANLFKSKYLGIVPNDDAGRISLWNDIVEHRKNLQKMRAIENFTDEDVSVEKGSKKTSVVIKSAVCPVNSMSQLYITTTVE